MKILVAVDGSAFTKRMLAYLAAHDEWLGGRHEYTVVHAVPAVPARAATVLDKQVLLDYYDAEAEKVIKPIRQFFDKQGIKASYVNKVGVAADTIAGAADKGKFDLLRRPARPTLKISGSTAPGCCSAPAPWWPPTPSPGCSACRGRATP